MNAARLGKFAVAVAALVVSASNAEAGHSRSCRTCSYGGRSAGAWYHFSSGSGMYVPYASKTSAAPSGPQVYSSGQIIMSPSYATGPPPVRYVRPCGGCR